MKSDRRMRALVVDDEIHAREELSALIEETGELSVAGSCANALEALQEIRKVRPEVVFLDIQMPVVNGFELLSMIDVEIMPSVVFVTAYDEYAIKAFEENALDYLLKPVEKERLGKTVRRLRARLGRENGAGGAEGSPPGARPSYPYARISRIPCVSSNRVKLINTAEVEFVRSDIAGLYVVCSRGEFYTELTLRVLEERTDLVRCHKQFLVNMDCIDEIVLHENMLAQILTKSGRSVPVSRRYLKKLKESLHL